MNRISARLGLAVALSLVVALLGSAAPAQAYDPDLPSLWKAYQGDFILGTFGDWSSDQAIHHYRTSSPANALKLDSQIGSSNTNSLSRQTYVDAVDAIESDPSTSEVEKADAIEEANENVVLQSTTAPWQSEGILQAIEAYNAAHDLPADERKVVRAHVLAWHGGQQPNYFFCNGFKYDADNPDWASPRTMLHRLDNYIKQMMEKYKKYDDIIYSWDVVNEPIDDYTGQIRNADDPQVGQWGRIFRRKDLDGDPDARLHAESAWVRQAFSSARTWSEQVGAHWKLYLNDYQDSNKPYEPKLSQTVKMLKPIYAAGNIDGYGMQGRLSWAYPSIDQLRAQIKAGLTVADEISVSESDIRSDFEPNPNYDSSKPSRRVTEADGDDPSKQWPAYGSCSWTDRSAANGNTFDVCNSPVRRIPAWGTGANTELADSPAIMKKQADFAADWMDLLLSFKGKVKAYQFDGTSDTNTFNRTDGAHLWSGADDHHEKYSFFAVLGAPERERMREAIAVDPGDASQYTEASWAAYMSAKKAAEALVSVRIYTLDDVNAVKDATTALKSATNSLEEAPAVAFKSPAAGATVSGETPVVVTLSGSDLQAYNLRVDSSGVKYVYKPTAGDDTAQLDTTTLSNGEHTLLASVKKADGNSISVTQKIVVDNAAAKGTVTPSIRILTQPSSTRSGRVEVNLSPATAADPDQVAPRGRIKLRLKHGSRIVVRHATVQDGSTKVRIPPLHRGLWKAKVSYSGSDVYERMPATNVGTLRVRH